MFPLCHIYFAGRVIDNPSDYTLLGSFYPDAVISNELKRDITHYNTRSLLEFSRGRDARIREFSYGAVTHGVDLEGLDYYSDESYPNSYKGYCFEKAKIIKKDVIDCCNIPEEWGLWKAHNFIEMAFELYLNKRDSSIRYKFKNILEDKELIEYVSLFLSAFYDIDRNMFIRSFEVFSNFFEFERLDENSLAKRYSLQLARNHGIKNFNSGMASRIILNALDVISDDVDNFFEYTVFRVKRVIASLD